VSRNVLLLRGLNSILRDKGITSGLSDAPAYEIELELVTPSSKSGHSFGTSVALGGAAVFANFPFVLARLNIYRYINIILFLISYFQLASCRFIHWSSELFVGDFYISFFRPLSPALDPPLSPMNINSKITVGIYFI